MFAHRPLILSLAVLVAQPLRADDPPPVEEAPAIEIAPAPPLPAQGPPKGLPPGVGMGMGGGLGGGPPGYWATLYPSRPVLGTNNDFSLVRQQMNIGNRSPD